MFIIGFGSIGVGGGADHGLLTHSGLMGSWCSDCKQWGQGVDYGAGLNLPNRLAGRKPAAGVLLSLAETA